MRESECEREWVRERERERQAENVAFTLPDEAEIFLEILEFF